MNLRQLLFRPTASLYRTPLPVCFFAERRRLRVVACTEWPAFTRLRQLSAIWHTQPRLFTVAFVEAVNSACSHDLTGDCLSYDTIFLRCLFTSSQPTPNPPHLHHPPPTPPLLAGLLILSLGLNPAGAALSTAANVAGAVSLAIDNNLTRLREVVRTGACDFVVTTLDEAIRAMKNEVRKHAPLSVALEADPIPRP